MHQFGVSVNLGLFSCLGWKATALRPSVIKKQPRIEVKLNSRLFLYPILNRGW